MTNRQTLPIHLKQTDAFVAENPSEINLIRRERQPDGKGGFIKLPPLALPPQTMRLVAQGNIGSVTTITTPDGRLVIPTFKLIGTPPIDIAELDTFILDDQPYEVVRISLLPAWCVQADVIEHA